MKNHKSFILHLSVTVLIALPASITAQNYWTGLAGSGNTNWSNAGNWSAGVPDPTSQVVFDDVNSATYVSTQNAVNNFVDAGFTSLSIRSLQYSATANNRYYGTLIPSGATLTLAGNTPEVTLGAGYFANTVVSVVDYFSIAGPGTLSVNNPVGTIDIHQVGGVTLNLSNLTNFTANVSNLWVGVTVNTGVSAVRSPLGTLLLAKTNTITTAANAAAPGILLGRGETGDLNFGPYFGGQGYGRVQLGVQNVFNTDGLVVGGARAATFTPASRLNFTPATAGNSFTLRGSAGGSTPASVFSVADGSATESGFSGTPFSSQSVYGDADFSGGTVDIMANTINVGRTGFDDTDTANNRNAAIGTLLFESGTIDTTNLNLGYYQYQLTKTTGQGTLTARSNAVLNVRNNLTMGYIATFNGLSNGLTSGILTVSNSAVVNVGGNIVDGGGATTINLAGGINMQPSGDATPGNVAVKNLNGFGAISNANSITLAGTVIPGTIGTPNSLLLSGNLTVTPSSVLHYNIGTSSTIGPAGGNDYIALNGSTATFNNPRIYTVLAGALPPSTIYRLIDCTNATSVTGTVNAESPRYAPIMVTSTGVVMVVSADTTPGTVTWNGSLGNVWDTSLLNTNWVYSGSQDAFRQYDNVLFDDSCSNQVVMPNGTLYPSSITFNGNTKNFWVTNRYQAGNPMGGINGATGITKHGTNTVTWGLTNTFTGPVNINNGVFKLFDPTFSGGGLVLGASNGPVTVASGATLDIGGSGVISPGKTNFVSGNGYNGMGVITNSAGSGNPTERWYFKLLGDSTFALNSAPMTIQNPAQTATYGGWLDLNGFTLTKSGASFFTLQQCSVTNSGSINLAGGELRLNHSWLGGAGSLNLSNATVLACGGNGTTSLVTKASINIPANAVIAAPNNLSAATPTFTIGSPVNLAGNLTVSNFMVVQITNPIAGAGSLVKWGTSNLLLAAANTYTGPTTINLGRLTLSASGSLTSTNITLNGGILDVTAAGLTLVSGQSLNLNASTANVVGNVTVPSGATLTSIGTNNGNLVANSGTLSPGPLANVGTLQVTNGLTLNAANAVMNLGATTNAGGVDNDLIICNDLTLGGVSTIVISPVGALVSTPNTPYTLIRYTGSRIGTAANLNVVSSNPRYTFTVIDPAMTPGLIQIQVSSSGSTVDVWQGLNPVQPTAWDTGITTNWLNSSAPSAFYAGDTAMFDNTGLTNGVDLVGTLNPAAIIVSNNTTPYTLRGSGRLSAGTLELDASSTGGLIIANASSNTFNGAGITLNPGTTLTLTQAPNTFLTSALIGNGQIVKAGANILTVVGNSQITFSGTNLISGGTLRPAGTGALGGTNATIVAAGGTLDINGKLVEPATFASGNGNGSGAVDNMGTGITVSNGVSSLTLTGPTTLGASSNRWDIGRWLPDPAYNSSQPPWMPINAYSTFNAQSNVLVKIGASDLWINTGGETYLADVNVGAGRLVINNPTWKDNAPPTLGYPQNTVTISNGATFALAAGSPFQMQANGVVWGVEGGNKSVHVLTGGTLESVNGSNSLSGVITLETGASVRAGDSSGMLTLDGTVGGPGNLALSGSGGTLQLAGTGSYGTATGVTNATLRLATSTALPANSTVSLSNSGSGLSLASSVIVPANEILKIYSLNSGAGGSGPSLSGDGTWSGPVYLTGNFGYYLAGSENGLHITGPIISSNASGTVTMDFNKIHLGTALQFQGTLNVTYQSGLSAGTANRPNITLDGQNYWTNMTIARGRLNIRTNNALPPLSPITAGTLLAGVSDRTLILDLGGFNQTLSSLTADFGYINTFLIGNSSATDNSVLTYAGTGANSWSAVIADGDPESGPTGATIGLSVTSGQLSLTAASSYTGPTTVTGGTLLVNGPNGQLGNTEVRISGTGTLGGTGIIGGSVTNAAGGTLSPGILIGTLTINNNLTLESGSTSLFGVNLDSGSIDKVVCSGDLTYGGTLVVNNLGTQALTNGTVLQLFSAASYTPGTVTIQPATPGPALAWDTSSLTIDGTLKVVPGAPTISGVTVLPTGNISFTLTGTAGQAYSVLASTNVALPLPGWSVLASGNLSGSVVNFTDLTATNYPVRFYTTSAP